MLAELASGVRQKSKAPQGRMRSASARPQQAVSGAQSMMRGVPRGNMPRPGAQPMGRPMFGSAPAGRSGNMRPQILKPPMMGGNDILGMGSFNPPPPQGVPRFMPERDIQPQPLAPPMGVGGPAMGSILPQGPPQTPIDPTPLWNRAPWANRRMF